MKWIKQLAPYAIAVTIIVLLLRQIDPLEVVRLLIGIDGRWLLLGFAAYVFTNVARAYRYSALLELDAQALRGRSPRPDEAQPPTARLRVLAPLYLLPEMFALSFLNNTLPSRAGELSFPYFMWQRHAMAVGESSAALIVVRIFDYVAVALLYIVCATANLYRLTADAATAVRIVAVLLFLSLLGLLAVPWLGQRMLDAFGWLVKRLGLREGRTLALAMRFGEQAVSRFQRMHSFRIYAATLGWSIVTWAATFAWFAAFMQAIKIGQPLGLVVVGATFAMLAKAVPFITVGGFGAHEAGWTLGFSLVGMPVAQAIASGFAVNLLTLLASAIFGGSALLMMQAQARRQGRAAEGDTAAPLRSSAPLPPDGPVAP